MARVPLGTCKAAGCEWGKAHVHWGFPTEGQLQALQISASGFDLSVHGLAAPTQVILGTGTGKGSFRSSCLEHLPGVPLAPWRTSEGRNPPFLMDTFKFIVA